MNPSGSQSNSGNPTPARMLANPLVLAGLLVVATVVTYWSVSACGFLNFDDDVYVTGNGWVLRPLSWAGIRWAFTTLDAGFWHPLTWLSYMLDYQGYGLRPGGYHLTNLLLHIASTVTLFFFLNRMTGRALRAAFVAALFALHPLHVESVAWVAERKDVLSTCFGFLSLLFYARYAQAKIPGRGARLDYALALFWFLCGLMSKTMLVTWPVLMLGLDFWPLERRQNWKRLLLEKVPFFVLSFIAGLLTLRAEKMVGAIAATPLPLATRLMNAATSLTQYLWQTVWPVNLCAFYPYPKLFSAGSVGLAALLLVVITLAALNWMKAKPYLISGWFWFIIAVLPVSGLVQVGAHARADRYTYVPLVGVFVMLTWGMAEQLARWRWPARLGTGLAVLALGACALRSVNQLAYWQNGETLFRHALAVTEHNRVAWDNLGTYLAKENRTAEAIACYEESLRIQADDPDAWYNWGNVLTKLGDLPGAVEKYRRALQAAPGRADILNNLGFALAAQQHTDEAVAAFEAALRADPELGDAHNNFATVLFGLGRFPEAETHFRAAARLTPDKAQVWSNLGDVLRRLDRPADAAESYRRALQLEPENVRLQERLRRVTSPVN